MFDPTVLCGSKLSEHKVKLFNKVSVCCHYGEITAGAWIKHKLKIKFFML